MFAGPVRQASTAVRLVSVCSVGGARRFAGAASGREHPLQRGKHLAGVAPRLQHARGGGGRGVRVAAGQLDAPLSGHAVAASVQLAKNSSFLMMLIDF